MTDAEAKRQRVAKRMARRVMIDGHWVSEIAPPEIHGTSTCYMNWGCHCEPCRVWYSSYQKVKRERQLHNRAVIDRMFGRPPRPTFTMDHVVGRDHLGRFISRKSLPPTTESVVEVIPAPATEIAEIAETVDTVKIVQDQVDERAAQIREKITPPPMAPSARSHLDSVETLHAISKAYYEPEWVTAAHMGPEGQRERRVHGEMEIIVGGDDLAPVIAFSRREVGTGKSEVLTEKKNGVKKSKGGRGGSVGPKSQEALMKALKAAGCTVEQLGSGHLRVAKDDGPFITIPSTPSDWRSLKNTVAQARKSGLL